VISESRGEPIPVGVVRYEVLNSMAKFARQVGPVKNLDDVVSSVRRWDPAFRPYKNRYKPQFALFSLLSDVANRNECSSSPAADAAKRTSQKYGEYLGSAFRNDSTARYRFSCLRPLYKMAVFQCSKRCSIWQLGRGIALGTSSRRTLGCGLSFSDILLGPVQSFDNVARRMGQ